MIQLILLILAVSFITKWVLYPKGCSGFEITSLLTFEVYLYFPCLAMGGENLYIFLSISSLPQQIIGAAAVLGFGESKFSPSDTKYIKTWLADLFGVMLSKSGD